MTPQPQVERRPAQPYLGIRARVTDEAELRRAVDRGFPELFGWLQENDVAPAGPPFIRFVELDGGGDPREIEMAVPVATAVSSPGPGRIQSGALPAGRYATLLHVGPYASSEVPDLSAARTALLGWAEEQGVELESSPTEEGTEFRACVERYITDPSQEPDWSKWETELAYLTAEA
jgi:effector-binding domain-containing protein